VLTAGEVKDQLQATVIARQLGKGLLLSVVDDLEVEDRGLSFAVRGRRDVDRVRIVSLGLDRFRIEVGPNTIEPLHGFDLASEVRRQIGKYEDVHREILDIFSEVQYLYRDHVTEAPTLDKYTRHQRRKSWTEEQRKYAEGKLCLCGCGRRLPTMKDPTRRRYYDKSCVSKAYKTKRGRRVADARSVVSAQACACGCGSAIGDAVYPGRKSYASRACQQRACQRKKATREARL
jgi:hypothetical protein